MKAVVRTVTTDAERRLIRAALEATAGKVAQAAERLGLSRHGQQIKMRDLGLRSKAQ